MPTDAELLERCLAICDDVERELKGQKTNARGKKYDRQSVRQIDFGIRTTHRIRERLRELLNGKPVRSPGENQDRLLRAFMLAETMRKILKKAKPSAWQQDMLRQLDDLMRD